jgi:uncharacterized RDD family membrane protein YckC
VIETASWGRRILALLVDWLACYGVAGVAVQLDLIAGNPSGVYTMALFILEATVFTALLGGSFGKLATRLRVVRADGSGAPPDLLRSLIRAVLVALVIPPLVFRPDGRGLHDMAAGTATVTLQTAKA